MRCLSARNGPKISARLSASRSAFHLLATALPTQLSLVVIHFHTTQWMRSILLYRRLNCLRSYRYVQSFVSHPSRPVSSTPTERKPTRQPADILLRADDEGAFTGDRGFWPQKDEQVKSSSAVAKQIAHDVGESTEAESHRQSTSPSPTKALGSNDEGAITGEAGDLRQKQGLWQSTYGSIASIPHAASEGDQDAGAEAPDFSLPSTSSAHSRKVDLSYHDPMKLRVQAKEGKKSLKFHRPSFLKQVSASTAFRTSGGLRRIVHLYSEYITPLISASKIYGSDPDLEAQLDDRLQALFDERTLDFLRSRGYEFADVISWAWVLDTSRVSVSIQRYAALANELRQQNRPFPRFVPLQLLRADSINAASLHILLSSLRHDAETHPLHAIEPDGSTYIDIAEEQAEFWDYTSAMTLVVRLLRHARMVAPDMFDDIVSLGCTMLFSLSRFSQSESFSRLTYMSNRLLSLTSMPTRIQPVRSARDQQKAQMTLLRRMLSNKPPLPITREGYRALIKVQLLHEKTHEEKAWARAKSASWPPWQKSKTGMEDTLEYTGKESRAMKLLRRMNEAGYAHGAWEKAAAVLAGWDTDKSPTIQDRKVLNMPPMAAFGALIEEHSPYAVSQLWEARISATRSVREAWGCFLEYQKAVNQASRRLDPYHAMFEKLLAESHDSETDREVLPGDAKETVSDPTAGRDLIYLESEIPSARQFYARMMDDGVRPAGRLLSLLLRRAESLEEGLGYVKDSKYSEVKKDVLLNLGKYSESTIRDTISSIPNYFLAAFLGLLARSEWGVNGPSGQVLLKAKDGTPVSGPRYAWFVLALAEITYVPAYDAVLGGLYRELRERKLQFSAGVRRSRDMSIFANKIVIRMRQNDVQPSPAHIPSFRINRKLEFQAPKPLCSASFSRSGDHQATFCEYGLRI